MNLRRHILLCKKRFRFLAEAERFELSVGCPTPRFQRGALDHYATLPGNLLTIYNTVHLIFHKYKILAIAGILYFIIINYMIIVI